MKRFKLLGTLFVWLIWLVSFWYCGFVIFHNAEYSQSSVSAWWLYTAVGSVLCWRFTTNSCNNNWTILDENWNYLADMYDWPIMCIWTWQSFKNNTSSSCNFRSYWGWSTWEFGGSCPTCPDCPTCEEQYTSQECQQEYSLMPISSCNSEYCWLNWLCPVTTWSDCTWSVMSELYINWINHLWAPIINISIPYEQVWDYSYTWDYMNIVISWENSVDYEYMDNIIRTQNSKPNTVDFNNIVSVLLPKFIPWLVIILFILFIFRFIKKIF